MILEEATWEAFGYLPKDLSYGSCKSILAICTQCGEFKVTTNDHYHYFCSSCSHILGEGAKGNKNALGFKHTKEWKRKNSKRMKGNKHGRGNRGNIHTEESKTLMSKNHGDQSGEKNPNFNGGTKASERRHKARRRKLGYIPLNSYFEDCEGHHITHNFVIYIPKATHKSVWHNLNTDQGMEAMNTLAVDFLVNGV